MDLIDKRDLVLRTFLEYGINECSENDLTKIDLAECAEAIVKNLNLTDVVKSFYCQQSMGVGGKQCDTQCYYCELNKE